MVGRTRRTHRRKGLIFLLKSLLFFCVIGAWLSGIACQEPTTPLSESAGKVSTKRQRIIGGKTDIRHPAVGALSIGGDPFCTGTLIAKQVVLTAAHCIDAARFYVQYSRLVFRIDMPDSTSTDGYKIHSFEINPNLLINHPKWNSDLLQGYDIGIAVLKEKVTITPTIPYNVKSLDAQWIGKLPLFLGYGLIQSLPTAISAKQKYGIQIAIAEVKPDRIGIKNGKTAICHGDSGGPALLEVDGKLRVISVNSYVVGPAAPGYPPRSSCVGDAYAIRTDFFFDFLTPLLVKYGDEAPPCKTDKECGNCALCGPNSVCLSQPIPQAPKSCQPCRVDSDCDPGGTCHRLPEGYRCLQGCSVSNCCPKGSSCNAVSRNSAKKACLLDKEICPPVSCQKDLDCGPGEECEPQKKQCQIKPVPRSTRLCHPCTTHSDCGGGERFCLGPKGQGRCAQPCTEGDFCPFGFVCASPFASIPKQCIPKDKTCRIPCTDDAACPAEHTCDAGNCVRKGGGLEGDHCDPTPCKDPLKCISTDDGKRCLYNCGVPKGLAGTPCAVDADCQKGMNCVELNGSKLCFAPCISPFECEAFSGGQCQNGRCSCFRDNDCGPTGVCNTTYSSPGACVSLSANYKCRREQECLEVVAKGSYCVSQGTQSLGQRCTYPNQCGPGLTCTKTDLGNVCVEDCTLTNKCQLGGECQDIGTFTKKLSICLCKDGKCPAGRVCEKYFRETYGVCIAQKRECQAHFECPVNYLCQKGRCVSSSSAENPGETNSETTPDGGSTDQKSPPDPRKPPVRRPPVPTPDIIPFYDFPSLDTGSSGGCGCSSSVAPSLPLPPLLLLLLLFVWRKPRR